MWRWSRSVRSILVSRIVDRYLDSAFCFARFSLNLAQRFLLLLVELFMINVLELDDLFGVLWHR